MNCEDRTLDLNALIDGELPGGSENALLAHMATCPACASDFAGLLTLRSRLTRLAPFEPPSEELATHIERSIARPGRGSGPARRAVRSVLVGVSALALAAAVILLLLPRHDGAPTVRAVADASLRQELPKSAIILADTRVGGADAWFARHHLATPPAPDLASVGFTFLGCRTDIIAGHRASILVYGRDGDRLTLVAWPTDGETAHKARVASAEDQAVRYWNNGELEFWVTGGDRKLVRRFAVAYRESA